MLNLHGVQSIAAVGGIIEAWRQDYNESHPHMPLAKPAPNPAAFQTSAEAGLQDPDEAGNPHHG